VTGSQAAEASPDTIDAGRLLAVEARQFCLRTKQTQVVAIIDAITLSIIFSFIEMAVDSPFASISKLWFGAGKSMR
jgi:hypothetical protein